MVDGYEALKRELTKEVPERIREKVRLAMEKGADEIVSMMKRYAPIDSGELQMSISWTWGEAPAGSMVIGQVGNRDYRTMRITIYAGNEHTMVTNSRGVKFQLAKLQEFGTKHMRANPYFYPSFRSLKKRTRSRIQRALNDAIKKTASGLEE